MDDPAVPLRAYVRACLFLVCWGLYVIAFILAVAAVLTWADDEARHPYELWLMFGASLTVLAVGLGLHRFAKRPTPPQKPEDTSPTTHFFRTTLGPAWADWAWLALLELIVLPLACTSKLPLLETLAVVLMMSAGLNLFLIPALILTRREWVALELHPAGLVLRTRGGRVRQVPRGELRVVRLSPRQVKGFRFRVIELELGERRPVILKGFMNRPLLQIATAVAVHMGVALQDLDPHVPVRP